MMAARVVSTCQLFDDRLREITDKRFSTVTAGNSFVTFGLRILESSIGQEQDFREFWIYVDASGDGGIFEN